jgi:hypothetical protein
MDGRSHQLPFLTDLVNVRPGQLTSSRIRVPARSRRLAVTGDKECFRSYALAGAEGVGVIPLLTAPGAALQDVPAGPEGFLGAAGVLLGLRRLERRGELGCEITRQPVDLDRPCVELDGIGCSPSNKASSARQCVACPVIAWSFRSSASRLHCCRYPRAPARSPWMRATVRKAGSRPRSSDSAAEPPAWPRRSPCLGSRPQARDLSPTDQRCRRQPASGDDRR